MLLVVALLHQITQASIENKICSLNKAFTKIEYYRSKVKIIEADNPSIYQTTKEPSG